MVVNMDLIFSSTASEEHSVDLLENGLNVGLVGESVDGDHLGTRHPDILHISSGNVSAEPLFSGGLVVLVDLGVDAYDWSLRDRSSER
jgi:hypothetical protein